MHKLIDNYLKWFADIFLVLDGGDSRNGKILEIFPPFYNKTGSKISFYFQETDGKVVVSDLSFTLKEMATNGFSITKSKLETINKIISHNGISFSEKDLEIYFECSKLDLENFYILFNSFIQTIIEIDSLSMVLNTTNLQQMFLEEIKATFEKQQLAFNPKPNHIEGSISNHSFDLSLEKSGLKPIYIKVHATLKVATQKQIAFSKLDIEKRSNNNPVQLEVFNYNPINESKIITSLKGMGVNFYTKDDIYSDDFFAEHYLNYRS